MSREIPGNHYVISDACRAAHGDEGTVDETLRRVRVELLRSLKGRPPGSDTKFHLRFSVERHAPTPEVTG